MTDFNEALVQDLMKDRKRDRRWRNIRFFAGITLILAYFVLLNWPAQHTPGSFDPKKPYVSLVRLKGEIESTKPFSANLTLPLLERAFADKNSKAFNWPTRSPVFRLI